MAQGIAVPPNSSLTHLFGNAASPERWWFLPDLLDKLAACASRQAHRWIIRSEPGGILQMCAGFECPSDRGTPSTGGEVIASVTRMRAEDCLGVCRTRILGEARARCQKRCRSTADVSRVQTQTASPRTSRRLPSTKMSTTVCSSPQPTAFTCGSTPRVSRRYSEDRAADLR